MSNAAVTAVSRRGHGLPANSWLASKRCVLLTWRDPSRWLHDGHIRSWVLMSLSCSWYACLHLRLIWDRITGTGGLVMSSFKTDVKRRICRTNEKFTLSILFSAPTCESSRQPGFLLCTKPAETHPGKAEEGTPSLCSKFEFKLSQVWYTIRTHN